MDLRLNVRLADAYNKRTAVRTARCKTHEQAKRMVSSALSCRMSWAEFEILELIKKEDEINLCCHYKWDNGSKKTEDDRQYN